MSNKVFFFFFYLDKEKDIYVILYKNEETEEVTYIIKTPNHKSGNLISNIAKVCNLNTVKDKNDMKIITGVITPSINNNENKIYMFELGGLNVATFNENGKVKINYKIPAIIKTLMSQTKDYNLSIQESIISITIPEDVKLRTDLHTHMHAILVPDRLIALGILHQIKYSYYFIRKIGLTISREQEEILEEKTKKAKEKYKGEDLTPRELEKKARQDVYINFADLILNNLVFFDNNIAKIRNSLEIMKDGQAVFTNVEKLYQYRYVFTKGITVNEDEKIILDENIIETLPHGDIKKTLTQMLIDIKKGSIYENNNIQENMLLWIGRDSAKQGIYYTEISQTCLVRNTNEMIECLENAHRILPKIEKETGVVIRYLAAIRRDFETVEQMLEAVDVLKASAKCPYIVGFDILGEELNDIMEMEPAIKEMVRHIIEKDPKFTVRIHAGENDSYRSNIARAIECVKKYVNKGEKFPKIRLGHGLYGYSLNSKEGKSLLNELSKIGGIIEFNLSSNVRLNNLTDIRNCPIKSYIEAGINCVQGTDGYGIYGTDSIEEQVASEYLLKLSPNDFYKMKAIENKIIEESDKYFKEKSVEFEKFLNGRTIREAISEEANNNILKRNLQTKTYVNSSIDSKKAFEYKIIKDLPQDKIPVVIAGGSFNSFGRETVIDENARKILSELIDNLNSEKAYFVVGHRMQGYEKAILDIAKQKNKKFEIKAIVPKLVSEEVKENLLDDAVNGICVSPINQEAGIYKSFNYEIFERQNSIVLAFDGNSPVNNLIQEAKNGKAKANIYVNTDVDILKEKAKYLTGYVKEFNNKENLAEMILKDNPELRVKNKLA